MDAMELSSSGLESAFTVDTEQRTGKSPRNLLRVSGELFVCPSMLRVQEDCNFRHMIAPVERAWVLEAMVLES